MTPVTVGLLIELLSRLPKDTLVYESTYCSNRPLDRSDLSTNDGPLLLYQRNGEIRLYIDDGEAFHGEEDKFKGSLFIPGEHWKAFEP